MPSLKSYFKISKPTLGNEKGPKQTPTSPLGISLPFASQSEKDPPDWPPQLERTRVDSVLDMSSSCYEDPETTDTAISETDSFINLKSEVIVNWLYQKQEERIWTTGQPGEGVVLRKAKGRYVCCPVALQYDHTNFYQMVARLNVCAAMTVKTTVIELILARNSLPYVQLTPHHRLQVIQDFEDLPHCQRNQYAAFVAARGMLVVWADDPNDLDKNAEFIQSTLMGKIWMKNSARIVDEKRPQLVETVSEEKAVDPESGTEKPRRLVLNQAFGCAVTLILAFAAVGGGWVQIAVEIFVDRNWLRMAFVLTIIPQLWFSLFFFQAFVGNILQLIGPVGQMEENTRYYSGKPPRRLPRENGLPHITIQMPVYKENLHKVIAPSVRSVKSAITTYELQGGTANLLINDDGMQIISDEDAQERQDFYEELGVGWVARPPHNPKGADGPRTFTRAGKFKKASNMNYGLAMSVKVEEELEKVERHDSWTKADEKVAYYKALRAVLEATEGEAWADGDIRIGDYILLIDSDTRVPQDCFHEAVSEMEQSPQVAILQYSSGVYNVSQNFFERGITFFTNLIYTQIRYAVANGDVAPFVGHNAVLRWSAMQDVAYYCPKDNREKFWSEETVSEDFEMSLRLQTHGYLVRLGAYKGDGYKEGVSLTVYDELMRWEKYAYGCSELLFQPIKHWPTKGPFTKLFRHFILSSMPLPAKITIMAYIGTYYAIGSAWFFTMMNYFLIGWFNGFLDHYYVDSFRVYFSLVAVFTALGNISLAVLRYRINEKGFFASLLENFLWIPLLVIFLGGVSVHVSQALLAHLFSVDMSWGSTEKEMKRTSFFQEVPAVIKKFKYTFLGCLVAAAGIVCLAKFVPYLWRITLLTAIWPLASVIVAHFLLPIVLNPNLMLFTW